MEDEVCSPSPECSPDVADDDSTHSFKCTRFEGYEAIVKERLTRTVASSSSRALVVGSKDDSCLPRAATNSSWKRTKSSGSLESQLHLNRIVVATDHPFLNDVPRQITLSCDTSLPPPPPLYNAISSRTKRTTKSVNSSTGDTSISDSMGYIDQDVPRTFADLGVFQKGM